MKASSSATKSFTFRLLFRGATVLFVALVLGSSGTILGAQSIRIKLVNGKNGVPMAGACVNVWVGNKRKDAMAIPTDKIGIAKLRLTNNRGELNAQNQWKGCGLLGVVNPVVRYGNSIRVNTGYVVCLPRKPHYSWLATMTFSTKKILESGVVTPNACGKAKASPKPGEIVLFVRPLNFWEKLKE